MSVSGLYVAGFGLLAIGGNIYINYWAVGTIDSLCEYKIRSVYVEAIPTTENIGLNYLYLPMLWAANKLGKHMIQPPDERISAANALILKYPSIKSKVLSITSIPGEKGKWDVFVKDDHSVYEVDQAGHVVKTR